MVRIAMLSFAHIDTDGYADEVKDASNAEIAAIWEDVPSRGEFASRKYGAPFTRDLEGLLSREDVDAVVVCSENSKHHDLMIAAAKAGKHIFTEKPLCLALDEAKEIEAAVHDAGIVFSISLPMRTAPQFLMMKEAVEKGWLGEIAQARMRGGHGAALDRWFADDLAWFGEKRLAGRGCLLDLGCYPIDMMRCLLGRPKRITALAANFTQAYELDDIGVALVEFENKAMGVIDVSWAHRSGPAANEIYGTEGFIGTGYPRADAILQSRKLLTDGTIETFQPRLPSGRPSLMTQWLGRIEGSTEEPDANIEDAVHLTEMLEGIYASASSGKTRDFSK